MSSLSDPATLNIVRYPHPTLRRKSKPVKRVDAPLREAIRRMFELMYESRGVGLAANQVDLPLRFFIANPAGNPDEGEELVFINPVLSRPKGLEEAEEGCLSFPELYGPVTRPKRVHVQAFGLDGKEIATDLDGFLSRVVQHETDHLDGVLFIDRMSVTNRMAMADDLNALEARFERLSESGEVPPESEIAARWQQWEQQYC